MSNIWFGLFGGADGAQHAPAESPVPHAWCHQFLTQHADSCLRRKLLCGDTASRDWAVRDSRSMTVSLDLDAAHLQNSVMVARSLLLIRGDRPVRLKLRHRGSDKARFLSTASALQDVGACVYELHIQAPRAPEDTLAALGAAFPAVRHLHLEPHKHSMPFALPPLASFPALTSLHLPQRTAAQRTASLASVRLYLTQLTSLLGVSAGSLGDLLAAPAAGASHYPLKHVSFHMGIRDNDIEAVLGLPNLESIEGPDLHLETDFSDRYWPVTTLTLTDRGSNVSLDLDTLAWTPQPLAGNQLTVVSHQPEWHATLDMEGFCARASDFRLECADALQLTWYWRVDVGSAPAPMVQALATAQRTLNIRGAGWTQGFVDFLTQAATGWRSVCVEVCYLPPTEAWPGPMPPLQRLQLPATLSGAMAVERLDQLLNHTAAVQELVVCSVGLSSDQHAARVWPWQRLTSSQPVNITDVPRLPDPHTRQQPAELHCQLQDIVVTSAEAARSLLNSLSPRLPHLIFTNTTSVTIRAGPGLAVSDQPAALHTTLQLVRAMRLPLLRELQLSDWTLSVGVLMALECLPAGQCNGTPGVVFDKCRYCRAVGFPLQM